MGGHCIGVDPYYLTTRAEQLGYQPEVILAGRRINNRMGEYVAAKLVKLLIDADRPVKGARVGILGLTFKENVSDLRNSRVPDIIRELRSVRHRADRATTPCADRPEARHEYGARARRRLDALTELDALILAVPTLSSWRVRSRPSRTACGRAGSSLTSRARLHPATSATT